MRLRRMTAVAFVALLAAAAPAVAQECPRTSLGDIEDEVMCPRCERPLNTVDREPQAQRQRAFITGLIDQCKSKEEIKTALVAQFGDDVLTLPGDDGFDATAYIVPVVVPLLALAAIGFSALRWRRRRPAGAVGAAAADGDQPRRDPGPSLDPGDSARLDEDLERYRL
jgi:cytochrome c-type biogenesis protein CcmH